MTPGSAGPRRGAQQCLLAGLLDELTIELVPVVLGRGVRLLDGLEPGAVSLELVKVVDAPGVTHLTYQVTGERAPMATT
jgi:dihydrofolate reductase